MSIPGESGSEEDAEVTYGGPSGKGELTKVYIPDTEVGDWSAEASGGAAAVEVHELHLRWVQAETDGLKPRRGSFIELGSQGRGVAECSTGGSDAAVVHVELKG